MDKSNIKGQSLIEVIIGIAVAGILIGATTAATVVMLRSNFDTKTAQIASFLASEYLDNLQSLAYSDWQKIYTPPASKGADSQFYLNASGTTFALVSGATTTAIEGKNFTRYFSIENVSRDSCGIGSITANATTSCISVGDSGIADDPSTQKITARVDWEGGRYLSKIQYLTRSQNKVFIQTDWSGGANQAAFPTSTNYTYINNKFFNSSNINYSSSTGAITITNLGGGSSGNATGTIDSTDKWAWNDLIGWLDFGYSAGNVKVYNNRLEGYASSSVGFIALNCNTTPNGDICGTSSFKVSNNGSGSLAGWAWNDGIGWISFCGNASGGSTLSGSDWICPASPTYQVSVSSSTGEFSGWAWNDIAGWISFNCSNTSTCGTVNYKVKTDWRP
jgi:type II secretory pathway pseudopilin PulG